MPIKVTAAANSSALAGSPASTTNAATSIGPSTKTSSKSEVSAARAAARRCWLPVPGAVASVHARRIAAVSGGYVAPANAEAMKISGSAASPPRATSSRPISAERMQHGGGKQDRSRPDPVGEPSRHRAECGAGQSEDAAGEAGRRVPSGGLLDEQQQRERCHADAEPGDDADDQAGPGRRASSTRQGTDATRSRVHLHDFGNGRNGPPTLTPRRCRTHPNSAACHGHHHP